MVANFSANVLNLEDKISISIDPAICPDTWAWFAIWGATAHQVPIAKHFSLQTPVYQLDKKDLCPIPTF